MWLLSLWRLWKGQEHMPSSGRGGVAMCMTGQQLSGWGPVKGNTWWSSTFLIWVEWVFQDLGTSLYARAPQIIVTWDPLPSPGRISMGKHHRIWQSLAHTKVNTVYPWRFTEETGPQSFCSRTGDLGMAIFILILWRSMETLQGTKATQRTNLHSAGPPCKGHATLPRKRHLRNSTAVPISRSLTRRTGA